MARDAPGAPLSSLASSSIISYLLGLAEAAAAGHDDRGLVELRTGALLDVAVDDLGRAGRADVGHGELPRPSAAPPPDSSATNDFGRTSDEVRAAGR